MDNHVRIVHLCEYFHPFISGPIKRITDMINYVGKKENHIVVTFDKNDNLPEFDSYNDILIRRFKKINSSDFHRLRHAGLSIDPSYKDFVKYIRNLKPVCLIIYWVDVIPKIIVNILPEMWIVYTPYTYRDIEFDDLYCSPRIRIVLFSKECEQEFIKAGIHTNQIIQAEKPIDTNFFCPLNVIRNPNRLLYVGRIVPSKNIPQLILSIKDIFRDYPKTHFHIVGEMKPIVSEETTTAEIEKIQNISSKLGISDRIIFQDKKMGKDLIKEFSEASIHLMAGTTERKNTSTQESLTMGMQCVNLNKQHYD